MTPKYRFFIQSGNTRRQAFPIYGTDLFKKYAMESNQMFYRATLDGKLKFFKSDYGFIMSFSFDSIYYVIVEMSTDGKSWREYFRGKFMRTDCTINSDEAWLETGLTPVDNYENILAGLDKEFNLIELAPEIKQVGIFKRPGIQIYVDGDSVLTTFVGGTYFEQQVTPVDVNQGEGNIGGALAEMGFQFQKTLDTVTVKATDFGEESANGNYAGWGSDAADITIDKVGGGDYKFRWYAAPGTEYETQTIAELIRISTGEVIATVESEKFGSGQVFLPGEEYTMTAEASGGTALYTWSFTETYIYARLLHDKEAIEGMSVFELAANDIAENNANYKYASPVNIAADLAISLQLSAVPTEWGQYQPGLYFTKPVDYTKGQFHPIGRSSWIDVSIWFAPTILGELYDAKAKEKYTLRHAYPLWDCINVLVEQVAPELTFSYSSSSFLNQNGNGYGDINPVSKLAFETLITQKTNLLKGEYDQPAQKAMITLKQVFDMLKSCFQCYWFIDGDELRIEHISYFQNGLRYPGWDGSPGIAKDLTAMIHPRTLKPWSFGQSEYSFEKENMPAWYQFEWGDDVTFPFKGYPVEVLSNYVKKDNTETIAVNKFVSDVDLMLLNPSAFSEEGFVLMLATKNDTDDGISLPIISRTIGIDKFDMQNGYAAFCDLQERYYLNSLPASRVSINKTTRTVKPTRGKVQEVEFPAGDYDLNVHNLIRTSLGDGQIRDLRINLSSRFARAILLHDTE